MKLLFDENISRRLISLSAFEYPDSVHVETLRIQGCSDQLLWDRARDEDFIIVSKDDDFRERALLYGPPPKVVWLSIGNASTIMIAELLKSQRPLISEFAQKMTKVSL